MTYLPRPITTSDLLAMARAVHAAEWEDRPDVARNILQAAALAERSRQEHGRNHDVWGDGTVMSAALSRQFSLAREPRVDDAEWRETLVTALRAIDDMHVLNSSRMAAE